MGTGEGIVVLLQGGFFNFQLHDMAADIVQLGRQGIDFRTDHGAGFIHQVDGLIRQEPVGDVAVGEGGGGDQGIVLDLDAMEDFIPLLQTAQDSDGIFHGRLGYHDGLETTFQGGILLDILTVLVQGGGTDTMELTTGQHRLQDVSCVHGTVRLAGTDDGVQLIDEQDDAAVALLDFRQDGLQTLFKLTAELGAGDQAAHIQGEDGLILQAVRHVSAYNPLGQAFSDSGFTDTGFTDQDGVVLGFTGKNTDDIPDFAVATDDRIQLLFPGQIHQVGTVLLQRVIGVLRGIGGDAGSAADFAECLEEGVVTIAKGFQQTFDVGGRFGTQAHPDVLNRQVFILHPLSSFLSFQQCLLHVAGDVDLAGFPAGTGYTGNTVQVFLQAADKRGNRKAALGEQLGDEFAFVLGQGEHQVLLLHLHMLIFDGKRLSPLQGIGGLLRELIHIHGIYLLESLFD